MDIRWTTEASSNLEQISVRIAEDKPEAALKTAGIIFERMSNWSVFRAAAESVASKGHGN